MTPEPDLSVFRLDRPGIRMVLGDLEAEIMEIVWAHPSAQGMTVRDIFEVLYERRGLAYTTVMSTMARLAKKNFLRVEKSDQAAYVYYQVLSEQELISCFVGRLLNNLLLNFSGATLAHIEALPDAEEAARARALLDEITRRRAEEEQG
jgi:predicted transcriptional regulator